MQDDVQQGIIISFIIQHTTTNGKKGKKGKQCKAMADEDRDAFGEFSKVQPEYTKGKDKEKAELFSFLKKSDEQTHQLMIYAQLES